jgi:hypothetical protein
MLVVISIFTSVGCQSGWLYVSGGQRHTNSRHQVAQVTKFCTVTPDICGSSVWNLFHVTFLVPSIVI